MRAKITDDGLDFGEAGDIIYSGDALLKGIVQWFNSATQPTGWKEGDGWIDNDNPTIADSLTISTATTLTWASPSHVNATGTTTVTLPTGAKAITGTTDHTGVVMFCIRNANLEDGMVTVTDGTLTVVLFPQESVTVRHITAWEVVS